MRTERWECMARLALVEACARGRCGGRSSTGGLVDDEEHAHWHCRELSKAMRRTYSRRHSPPLAMDDSGRQRRQVRVRQRLVPRVGEGVQAGLSPCTCELSVSLLLARTLTEQIINITMGLIRLHWVTVSVFGSRPLDALVVLALQDDEPARSNLFDWPALDELCRRPAGLDAAGRRCQRLSCRPAAVVTSICSSWRRETEREDRRSARTFWTQVGEGRREAKAIVIVMVMPHLKQEGAFPPLAGREDGGSKDGETRTMAIDVPPLGARCQCHRRRVSFTSQRSSCPAEPPTGNVLTIHGLTIIFFKIHSLTIGAPLLSI